MGLFRRLLILACAGLLGADVPRSRQPLAAFECRDYAGREWPRTLVGYAAQFPQGAARPGRLRLMDQEGKEQPLQLADVRTHPDGSVAGARVFFYASLPKDGRYRYELQSGPPAPIEGGVTAAIQGQGMEVATPLLAVQLPAPDTRTYAPPVGADQVPAPLLRFRLHDGRWAGKGRIESERKVAEFSQRIVAEGPLFREYAYRLRFAPQGRYDVRVRVELELPLVRVAEEYDMGEATAGKDLFALNLSDGWKPNAAVWAAWEARGRQAMLRPRRMYHDTNLWIKDMEFEKWGPNDDGEHVSFYPWNDFGAGAQWYGVFEKPGGDRVPYAGIMTEHSGSWRLPDQSLGSMWLTSKGLMEARMRISIGGRGSPPGYFSTAEIDPDLPQTLGRRMWALTLGPRPALQPVKGPDGKETGTVGIDYEKLDLYRNYYGFINLDEYKDFVLEWPEQKLSRPRGTATARGAERLRAALDRCPGKEEVRRFYVISRNPEDAVNEAKHAIRGLQGRFDYILPYFISVFRQVQYDYGALFYADSALACPILPPDLRQALRARIALLCYILSHPDFCPRGAGVHMGNPNMPASRFMAMPVYAAIIQDHPQAKAWLDGVAPYVKWDISHHVAAAGGTHRECPHYSTYGPALFHAMAATALRNAGYDLDRFEPLKNLGRYYADIETPPTTVRGAAAPHVEEFLRGRKVRLLPGFGNGTDIPGGQPQMLIANLFADTDPAFAARMMGSFQESGAFLGTESRHPGFWLYWNPDIKPLPPPHADGPISGFGGILRAHVGPEETYACLRQGYSQSHWNPDQGTFVLYARGQCISPPTGWFYETVEPGICHDSLVCFGGPFNGPPFGRMDTRICDYGSTPSLGHLHGRIGLDGFDWHRQVLLVRSPKSSGPNYVLLRDATRGDGKPPSWWYQWLVTKAENVTPIPGGVRAAFAEDVLLDVIFLSPENPKVAIKGTRVKRYKEDYCQMSVSRPAGEAGDYFVLFYPYKRGEPPPRKVEMPAEGVARVATAESDDYVFCGAGRPVMVEAKDVRIEGFAGMVRLKNGTARLVNASARPAALAGLGVAKAAADGPWEYEVRDGKLSPVQAEIPPAPAAKPAGGSVIEVNGTEKPSDGRVRSEGIEGWIAVDGEQVTLVAARGQGLLGYKEFFVEGEAPYTCVWKPGEIVLSAKGRRRIFLMPMPTNLVPPPLVPPGERSRPLIDWPPDVRVGGHSVQAGWSHQRVAVGLDDVEPTAVIRAYTNPPVWPANATTRMLPLQR